MVVAHVITVSVPIQRIAFLGFLDLVGTKGLDLGPVGYQRLGHGLGLTIMYYSTDTLI